MAHNSLHQNIQPEQMKVKTNLFLFCLCALLFFIHCKESAPENTTEPTTTAKSWSPEDMRDIPGLKRQRGLISSTDKATPGYVLFHPGGSTTTSTYLLNYSGEVVKKWDGELGTMLTYLMDDGRIIRGERDPDFPTFAAGGQSGRLREYDWEGNMTWDFEYATDKLLTHHDIAIMPNGNILAIAWEVKTKEECIDLGINPANLPEDGLWFDKIIEIKPERPSGGSIVWEWRMWDHLIQDFDANKPNYGDPSEHPRRINLNPHIHKIEMTEEQVQGAIQGGFMTSNAKVTNQGSDLTHLNAIDYNAELDQIALSSYNFNEVYIIDHSASTDVAATSEGGKYGHGGDLLYRWGNPQNYNRGTAEDKILGHQHDVRWIQSGMPGEGNLMIFNNEIYGGSGEYHDLFMALSQLQRPELSMAEVDNYSMVLELQLPITDDGSYSLEDDAPFGPKEPFWSYSAPDKYSFFAPFVSSAHRMSNGHTFINSGPRGRFMEVTPSGEIVWEYLNPYVDDYRLPDGTLPQPVGPFFFAQYRVTHIPLDHPAVKDRNLTALSPQPEVFVPKPPPGPPPH